MIKITKLEMSFYDGYVEGADAYLNPVNIESVETDETDEKIIHIKMVSGELHTTHRTAINRIIERYY